MATHTLLVADHSQTVQRIVEMACAGEGLEVVAVADGETAIARINEQPPDIILADIGMPRRNGYEVAAFVKGRADLAHIPVVLLAGMFEAADESRARNLGCAEVLVKPLKPQLLMECVRHWLQTAPPALAVTAAPPMAAGIAAAVDPAGTAAPGTSPVAEDYFSRLDAAFKSLERPLGARLGDLRAPSGGDSPVGAAEAVPTLQELLNRLPEATRTRLTPPSSSAEGEQSAPSDLSVMDAIAARVLDHLSKRSDLLDEIARRVALRQGPGDGH